MPLITESLVALDTDLGDTKQDVIASLAGLVQAAGRADADGLTADALERESKAATGLPGGWVFSFRAKTGGANRMASENTRKGN